jgi:aminobenzoyl-glutamate utilization protein A
MSKDVFAQPGPALVDRLKRDVHALSPWLVRTRREFHAHPELGWCETETTRRIASELTALGYKVVVGGEMLRGASRLGMSTRPIPGEGDTGCMAVFDSGRAGPTVCLRVDIDALPINEARSGHRPASEGFASAMPSVMHACGHDGHIAIGLGVARILLPLLGDAAGKLLILFQPAEEGGRGARAVVEAGWMADVDLFVAIHIGLGVPSGSLALDVGGFLATRKFTVRFSGLAAHAGKSPEQGRNALLAACQAALGLHSLAQSGEPGVRVNVGTLHAGKTLNVVPDEAVLEFEIRAAEMPALELLDMRCRRMIEASAGAYEVTTGIELRGEASDWRNPPTIVDWAKSANSKLGAFANVLDAHSFGASEDATLLASAVADRGGIAGIFVLGADIADGHHTPHFDFDETVLAGGTFLLSGLIAAALSTGKQASAQTPRL